jgi:hypothetical protein
MLEITSMIRSHISLNFFDFALYWAAVRGAVAVWWDLLRPVLAVCIEPDRRAGRRCFIRELYPGVLWASSPLQFWQIFANTGGWLFWQSFANTAWG